MRNDLPKAITADDVIRRFDLNSLVKDRRKINENKQGLDKTENILYNFIESTLKGLNNVENQVDGKISTWFFNGIPELTTTPASNWETDEDKNSHIGDLYYDKLGGNTYQFILSNEEYSWQLVDDDDINQSMALANSNPDTEDGLRNIFVTEPTTPYEVGDIWIRSNGDLYRCVIARAGGDFNEAEWVISSEYANDNYVYDARAIIDKFTTYVTANYVCKVIVKTTKDSIEMSVSSATEEITNGYTTAIAESEGRAEIREDQVLLSARSYTANEIARVESEIGDLQDITQANESTLAKVEFEDVVESQPTNIKIHAIDDNISFLYPSSGLFPSSTLYPKVRLLRFTNTEEYEVTTDTKYTSYRKYYSYADDTYTLLIPGQDYTIGSTITGTKYQNTYIDYEIPDNLLYYDSTHYDELELNYRDQTCIVTKRCKYNSNGSVGLLSQETQTSYDYPEINLSNGSYEIELLGYSTGYIFARVLCNNAYTAQFYTKDETDAHIQVATSGIEIEFNEKLTNYSTTTEMNSAINLKANEITSSVSQTYSTKIQTTNAKNEAISTSKNYTDNELTNYSTTTQMNASITQKIENNNSAYVDIEVAKKVNNTDYTHAQIVAKINDSTSQVKISADKVNLQGYVTLSNLSTAGQTTINGANITTGTISAERLELTDYLTISSASSTYLTKTNASSTYLTKANASNTYATLSGLNNGTTIINGGCISTGAIMSGNYVSGTSGTKLNLSDGTIDTKDFKVSSTGQITSTGGTIGGCVIDAGGIYSGTGTNNTAGMGLYGVRYAFWAGGDIGNTSAALFRVDHAGYLVAQNADITGTINSSGGRIGGWNIGQDSLSNTNSSGNEVILANGTNSAQDVLVIHNGNNYPFFLRADGYMSAQNANISGTINATSGTFSGTLYSSQGKIGGWTLNGSSGFTSGNSSISANGELSLYPTTGGVYRFAAGGVRINADLGIAIASSSNGNVYSSSGNIDIKGCASHSVYIGCMSNTAGTTEKNSITVYSGGIAMSRQPSYGSDIRLKDKIKEINDVSWIEELRIKEYEYKVSPGEKNIGLIAQDYVDKEYAKYFLKTDEKGYYAIEYGNIANALIQYCQKLKKRVEDLEKRLNNE